MGLQTRDIAARLFVSRQAVTYHIGNLLAKFQAGNRAGLVARAYVLELLHLGWPPRVRLVDDPGTRSVSTELIPQEAVASR